MNEFKINALKLRELLQLISDISDSEVHMVITKITSNSLEAYANSSEFHTKEYLEEFLQQQKQRTQFQNYPNLIEDLNWEYLYPENPEELIDGTLNQPEIRFTF